MRMDDKDAMDILLRARQYRHSPADGDTRVYIAAGSQNTRQIAEVLEYLLNGRGIRAVVRCGEYASFRAEIMEKDSALHGFAPDYVVVLPYHTDYLDAAEWGGLWAGLAGATVIQSNYVIPEINAHGRFAANIADSAPRKLEKLNAELGGRRPPHVWIADWNGLASAIGKRAWFDPAAYFLNKSGFAMKFIPEAADFLAGMIGVARGKTRKCLVLDLDNTLWGGVVGEEGGITLDPNDALGEAFRAFQGYALALKNRGVILAVASKNDEEVAKAPFRDNPDMRLALDDIAVFKANWNDKASNIREIAAELNIGVDSLVFFDDNPVERGIVEKLSPEVLTVDVPPDPAAYVRALYDSGAFDLLTLSAEDLSRAESYRNNARRAGLQTSAADYGEYLRTLEMKAKTLREATPRFAQLLNKSNQFNLRTRRYTEAEIGALAADGKHTLLSVEFRDRFDYYGIICCVILEHRGSRVFIDNWVMSCRVLKRGIENYVFNEIVREARTRGADEIIGEYLPTAKNGLVENLLDGYGFRVVKNADRSKMYSLALADAGTFPHGIGAL